MNLPDFIRDQCVPKVTLIEKMKNMAGSYDASVSTSAAIKSNNVLRPVQDIA